MSKLHVLSLVHNLFFGGDETRLLAFARTYDRDNFEHSVVSIHLPDEEYIQRNGSMRERFAEAGIEVIELGRHHNSSNRSSLRPDQMLATAWSLKGILSKLRQIIREKDVDIIDARLSAPIFIGAVTGKLCRIPSVGTTYSFEANPTLLQRMVTQFSFGTSSTIITDSEIWRSRIEKAIRWPGAKIVNIPNGIFQPKVERTAAETKALLGVPDDPNLRIVCQVSRLIEYKGHRVLLDAASRVLERDPNAFFLLVGHDAGGVYQQELKDQAKRLGISERVRIGGYTGSIGDVWNIVDVHSHASHLDSAPNAIIEGMSFGKPAVVTSVGGIPDLVGHRESGLVVETRNAEQLADGILELLNDPSLAKRFGDAARQRYLEQFTPEIMTRRHQELFKSLCGK